jgi:hypothetical protein
MRPLWMGIRPGLEVTRIVVRDGWAPILLKGRLPHSPKYHGAVETLCEAVALWCGRKVCAALVVDGPDAFCGTKPWHDTVDRLRDHPLFEVHLVSSGRPAHERDRLDGLHDYHELRQQILNEEAR